MPALQNIVMLLLGGICVIFLAVIAVRFFAALRTSRWIPTPATIVKSEARARRPGESGPETAAHIVYEYAVDGEVHRSDQLRARGIPLGATDLNHFLGRYPVGATVEIYYNPSSAGDSVLEREPLSLCAERLGCISLFTVAVALALIYGLTPVHALIRRWFPRSENEDLLALTAAMGIFLCLFGLVSLRQGLKERVVSSGVEVFQSLSAGGRGGATPVTMYRPAVVYAYRVGGGEYRCRQLRRVELSGAEEFAKRVIAEYSSGSAVRVFYDPSNPADAVLKPSPAMGFIVPWVLALVMFGIAASVSGCFRFA